MWIKYLFLIFCGLTSGVAIAAGTFAFIMIIGVVPRLVGKCHRAAGTMLFENAIIAGATLGCVWSLFANLAIPFGWVTLVLFGLSAGIFVGCIAIAIAEMLNTLPIFTRRAALGKGIGIVLLAIAFGKTVGSLIYFSGGMF